MHTYTPKVAVIESWRGCGNEREGPNAALEGLVWV